MPGSTNSENLKNKVSFILYEENHPPRFFILSKRIIKFLYYGLPTITLISLCALLTIGVYFEQIKKATKRKEPAIIKELKDERASLILAKEEITKERDQLQKKLGQGVESNSGLSFLSLFAQSPGRTDKTSSPEMSIEEISINEISGKTQINFKLINLTKNESRITGYIFVLLQNKGGLYSWPENAFDDLSMQISFPKGEFFATTRFRPVNASFPAKLTKDSLFKVIIFSRTGDLIFKQLITNPSP